MLRITFLTMFRLLIQLPTRLLPLLGLVTDLGDLDGPPAWQQSSCTNYLQGNNVSVINTATTQVVTTIPVGASPHGIAVTPDGSKVYVANQVP